MDDDNNPPNADLLLRLEAAERERDEVRIDRDWLRAQIEEARRGESELRVLLLRQSEALAALTAPKELPPAPERKRWWWPW